MTRTHTRNILLCSHTHTGEWSGERGGDVTSSWENVVGRNWLITCRRRLVHFCEVEFTFVCIKCVCACICERWFGVSCIGNWLRVCMLDSAVHLFTILRTASSCLFAFGEKSLQNILQFMNYTSLLLLFFCQMPCRRWHTFSAVVITESLTSGKRVHFWSKPSRMHMNASASGCTKIGCYSHHTWLSHLPHWINRVLLFV